MNSLLFALRPLASDFLPTIVFAVLVALHQDVRIATAGALGVALAQMAVQRVLMLKPSLIYVAVGVVMLKRGWMVRYLPPIASGRGEPLMIAWGYVWAGLMFVSAAANLAVAWWLPALWPAYLAVIPMASKIALFAVQYVSVRFIIRRRMLAEMAHAPAGPLPA
jgi:hypothetical protein